MDPAQAPGSSDAPQRAISLSPRTRWLAAAALVLAVSTPLAWLQAPRPDPYAVPTIRDPSWWLSPTERNAFRRLPVIVADLNGVFVLPGTEVTWAVGGSGMIAHSRDGGRTWQRQNISREATSPGGAPRPAASRPNLRVTSGRLVATAEAQQAQEATIVAPDLLQRTVGEASDILAKNRLRLDYEPSRLPIRPTDVIVSQSPAAGTRLAPGARVQVGRRAAPLSPSPAGKDNAPLEPSAEPKQPVKPPPIVASPIEQRDLFAVHFADAQRGWAVGELGVILATSNGGQHWEPQSSSTSSTLYAVHFLADGQHGWAAGDGGTILLTIDGGRRWQPRPTGVTSRLRSIVFTADGRRGWSSGANGTILTTATGGEQWTRQPSGTTSSLSSLHFDAAGVRGWTAGDGGTIVTTLDGGNRWNPQPSQTSAGLSSIRFAADNRRGWAVGAKGTLIATVDGGAQWAPRDSGVLADLRALTLTSDGQRGWIIGSQGTVLATTDSGMRWPARTAGRRSVLLGLHIDREGRRGWAAGGDGTLLGTADGGRSWQPQAAAVRASLSSVSFLADGLRGWAVGDDGVLLSTVDGGAHWEQRQVRPRADLIFDLVDVRFHADGKRGWAVTSGAFLGTTNGGAQWGLVWPDRVFLTGIHIAADDKHVWIVGREGLIATSSGDGTDLLRRRSGTSVDLFAVRSDASGQRGWAVGDRGLILVTSDGGATWRRRPSGTTASLRSVTFLPDSLRGWAAGWDGTILSTTDGGEQWQALTIDPKVPIPLNAVRFTDDGRHGWISGWGTILTTSDGGKIWTAVAHTTSPAPWYYLTWLVALALLLPALRRPAAQEAPQRSVADVLVSDKPLEVGQPDPLGFGQVARGLSRFLRNEQTKPPLTIAITGPWGSGKSSLMNLVRGDLRTRGFRPVWFNAWHHQKEEHLLAALLQNILSQAVPGLLTREGVAFRARLLGHRSGRRWRLVLPILALVSGIVGFLAADHPARIDAVVARAGTIVERTVGVVTPVFPGGVKESLEAAKQALRDAGLGAGAASQAIPTAVATLVLLFMVWRGITAFGVNPADLMATVSGRFKRRALEAKVGFRHEFAQEFHDVTRALHPRTMLILIDDLDRCRPENVLEVLEAVNFLVSSGDCFVIMGMELDRVRRCVGLGFKDVAEELTDREEAETTVEAPALAAESDEGKRRRAVFAQQYLEKLINIEVPVPTPTEVQAARVIAPEREPDDGLSRWRTLGARAARVSRATVPIAALLVAVVGGFWAALLAWPPAPAPALTTASSPASPAPASGSGVQPDPPELPHDKSMLSAVVVDGDSTLPSMWLAAWPLSGLLLAALVMFLKRPPIVVKDSDEFTQALKAWHPLVFSRRSTPRSAKRFLNRVRYYAMRQRDLPEERRIDRITGWVAARLGRAPSPPAAGQPVEVIPERVLVGLSAIEHCHPEWLADRRLFKDPEGFLADQPLPPALKPVVSSLGLGRDLLRYEQPFGKLSAGVRT